jgi:hypothetical protein
VTRCPRPIPIPRVATALSEPTVTWLAKHPDAHEVVSSVWATLERAGAHPGTLSALQLS